MGLTPAWAATDRFWTGDGPLVNGFRYWSHPDNWSPNGAPQNGDNLDLGGTSVNDLVDLVVNGINFYDMGFFFATDVAIYGNPITLSNTVPSFYYNQAIDHDEALTVEIYCGLKLATNATIKAVPWFDIDEGYLHLKGPIDLNGHDLQLNASVTPHGEQGNAYGNIYVSGAISGVGNVLASSFNGTRLEFNGPGNSFQGKLVLVIYADGDIVLNTSPGEVATGQVRIIRSEFQSHGMASDVRYARNNQFGDNATVSIVRGGRLLLNGYSDTIGNLEFLNDTLDSYPTTLDTGGGTLTLQGNIASSNYNGFVTPVLKGNLALASGGHMIHVTGTVYEGLDMQARMLGSGNFSKSGTAALLLQASNSFNSTISILAGVLDVRNAYGLGDIAGSTEIFEGNLTLRNVAIGAELLFALGGAEGEFPGSALTSIGVSSWAGQVMLNTNLVVNGDMTFTGPISGPGGVGCFGGGTIRLGGAQANTYTGTTLVRCPLVEFDKPYGVNAFSGPLIVGGLSGGPSEARWTNSYQSAGTLLTLYANGLVNLNNTTERFGSITFHGGQIDSGPFGICMLGNPVLTNASYLTVHAASTPAVINGFLQPAGGASWITVSNGVADPDLVINAGVVGNAPQLIKQGAGTMRLAGAGNYTGVTIVNEGTLEVAHHAALGSASFGTIVNEAATLRLNTFNPVPEGFALYGTGFDGTNGVVHAIGNTTVTGQIFLNGPSTIHVAPGALLAVDNIISGTGPLTKTGTGNLYLGGVSGGTGHNTYSGDTVVSAGLLYLSKNQGVRAVPGNLIVGPGAAGPATARFNRSATMNPSATISVNANGLLDLNGNDQTVPRLNLNDGGDVQTGAGTLGFSAGGVVSVSTLNVPQVGLRSGASISGKIALPSLDYLTFEVAPYGAAPFPGEGPELNVSAVIRDAGNIIKTGAGALRLGGANTFNDAPPNFSGDVFVNGGTLIAAHATALGGTAGWTFVNNSASLALLEGITITGENLYLNSDHPRALDNIAGHNTWTGPISLTRDTTVASSLDWSLTTSGVIGGAGRLTKVGAGTLWVVGAANNTHMGDTFVNAGILALGKTYGFQAVPASLVIGQPGGGPAALVQYFNHDQVLQNITVNATGLLDLNNYDEYAGDLTLNGGGDVQTGTGSLYVLGGSGITVNPANNNPATITGKLGFDVGNRTISVGSGTTSPGAHDLEIAATIFQANPPVNLTKTGAGRARFSGTNTYTGVTYVGSGALQVDGVQPQSAVELDHDTRLQGAGTVGHILFNGTTAIAPGASAGTLTCSNFDASGGAGNLEIELNGHPTGYDQIVTRGLVDLRGLALQVSLNFVPSAGQQFTLVDNDGSDAVTGTFDGLPQNASLTLGNQPFVISYTGGTGNDVVLKRDGQDIAWTNNLSGNWNVAANWSPNLVPTTNDHATINRSITVTVTNDVVCRHLVLGTANSPTLTGTSNLTLLSLTFGNGNLNGGGVVTVLNEMNWTGGTMGGSGRTILAPGAVLNLANAGGASLTTRTLENGGTVLWTGADFIINNAVITNRAGALFETRGAGALFYNGGTPRLDNAGTFRKSVSIGTTSVGSQIAFNNFNAVEIQAGTLSLVGGGLNHGTMDVLAGATLELASGTFTGIASSSMTGAGQLRFSGGVANLAGLVNLTGTHTIGGGTANLTGHYLCTNNTLNIAVGTANFTGTGMVAPAVLNMSGGNLIGSQVVTVQGAMNWAGGTMGGSGRTIISAGGTLNVANASAVNLTSRTLENGGTVLWTGANINLNGSVITNRAGALFEIRGAGALFYNGSTPRFDNAGTFRKSVNSGTTSVGSQLAFNNYGTVEILAGILAANGGYNSTANSLLHCALGGTTAGTGYGRLQVSGAVTLNGSLSVTLTNGFLPTTNDSFTVLTAGSRNGTFANFYYPSNEVTMQMSNTANSVIVRVTEVLSVAQPLLLSPEISGTNLTLLWTALSNRSYRVEFKPDLNLTNWLSLPGDVTALSNTASKLDALTPSNRFYRVRVLP